MVKKTLILTALFLLVLGNAASALAQAGPSFAQAWSGQSDKEKESFIRGVVSGVRILCMDITVGLGKAADPENVNKQFRECFNAYVVDNPAKMIATMNELYADKKNAFIPFDGIYKIAGLKMNGQNVDKLLEQSRQYAEGLKKKLEKEVKK
ncbi:hypothetical protein [Desulfolutivibrio sulfoxidireducens]|uniref:hypothetical protein n=1 Tax=Desulfolutivibrio sulfoxidireducens TaxID=2773299 RepID=UPI00159D8C8D|nr:hypothetical protein [Desulfolutivibrio sulfoxidireducens]QLA17450.1 hypothetical protein GD605_15855 [Desulfolutivibrio sulfoxidireducens]